MASERCSECGRPMWTPYSNSLEQCERTNNLACRFQQNLERLRLAESVVEAAQAFRASEGYEDWARLCAALDAHRSKR